MTQHAENVVPLDQIASVNIPKWVLCEVPACGWCTANSRGSFARYCEHVRTHTAEEWAARIDGSECAP